MNDATPPAGAGGPLPPEGEWVVTLDVEGPANTALTADLAVRALAVAVGGGRTYVAPRGGGYSFTVILGTPGAEQALSRAMELLVAAQGRAGLDGGSVVCAEVTLVGTRARPGDSLPAQGCENSAS